MQERGSWKSKVKLTVGQPSRDSTNRKKGGDETLKIASKVVGLGMVKGVSTDHGIGIGGDEIGVHYFLEALNGRMRWNNLKKWFHRLVKWGKKKS